MERTEGSEIEICLNRGEPDKAKVKIHLSLHPMSLSTPTPTVSRSVSSLIDEAIPIVSREAFASPR